MDAPQMELDRLKELLKVHSIQVEALTRLLMEKEFISQDEFFRELRKVQTEYQDHPGLHVEKIISGGQTGADQAALDAAIELGIPHGGSIPLGRKTEAGRLADKYQLRELDTSSYPKRTEQNVIDSDGTLIMSYGALDSGSEYTKEMAEKHGKPWVHVDTKTMSDGSAMVLIQSWIDRNEIKVLNVAGPRASRDPRIYSIARRILKIAFQGHRKTEKSGPK
jgi:Circularly permutated YpsA SLOG family